MLSFARQFYQANQAKIDLTHSAFVSVGGALSNGQVSGVMKHFNLAKAVDCFDNDLAGRIYGMRMAALADGKRLNIVQVGENLKVETDGKKFDIPIGKASVKELAKHIELSGRTEVWKPPINYKDWNDVVRGMPLDALELKTKFQRDENLSLLRSEMRERKEAKSSNLKGTAIATLVSDELIDATAKMTSLYPFMKQLVTSGSYTIDGYDDKGNPIQTKKKVNLLNSAERYYVANEIVTTLEGINTDLWLLAWQVQYLSWNDLFYSLDPQGWAKVMSGKYIAQGLIWEWKYLKY